MALPWRVRALLRVQSALATVGFLPNADALLAKPQAIRMAYAPPRLLVGRLPSVRSDDRVVPTRDGASVNVRVYRSANPTDQPLLYLHGGGFVGGGIKSCDHICRRLAHASGSVVVSVEYRLAPEHRYPVPLHDTVDAALWLLDRADELSVDPAKLVVGGDSAGGNLSAALALLFRDEGFPLAGQLLIYPALDLTASTPGINAYQGAGLTTEDCRRCARAYLGDHDGTAPYASPWFGDLTGVAPALVVTVDHDPLHDEGAAYVDRLRAGGVPTQHLDVIGHVHGSLSMPRLYRGIDDIYDGMVRFLKQVAAPAH